MLLYNKDSTESLTSSAVGLSKGSSCQQHLINVLKNSGMPDKIGGLSPAQMPKIK